MTPSRLVPRAPVAALLGVLAGFGAAIGVLAQHGQVLVHQCVADGTAGAIGLRLALLRHDAACPSELAVGGDPRQAFAVVVMIAAPVLAWHLAGLAAGVGLLAKVRAGVRAVGRVLAGLVALPEPAHVLVPVLRVAPVRVAAPRADSPLLGVPVVRGPPLATC